MIDVQNRTPLPGKEGRVTFALDGGTTLGGILSMADEATQEGTPWDRDTARKLQADIRTYPVAAGQSITAGDVVDVVGGEVTKTQKKPITVGSLPIGSTIQLSENGSPVDYIIVHRGLPSSMYDTSCNGTWVLRKDIFSTHQWNNSNVNNFENSTLQAYLNGEFLARFDSTTQVAINQVKIPYRPNSGTSQTVNSGADGLPCKVFALSGYEVGYTNNILSGMAVDGARLVYFATGNDTTANNKRIGYLNGNATTWWLRTPYAGNSTHACYVRTVGYVEVEYCVESYGVRPAIVLQNDFPISWDDVAPSQAIALTNATAGQPCEVIYSGTASLPGITEGQKIASDGVYGVGVLDGVLQVWSKDRPEQMVTGSYVGTGTYGSANPVVITLPFKASFLLITNDNPSNQDFGFVFLGQSPTGWMHVDIAGALSATYSPVTVVDNVVSWYSQQSGYATDREQFNYSGWKYHYIAFQ